MHAGVPTRAGAAGDAPPVHVTPSQPVQRGDARRNQAAPAASGQLRGFSDPFGHCAALRVQRLQPGGSFRPLPPVCVSEGDPEKDPTRYIPASHALSAHVGRVHRLAREGQVDALTAERHLNAHLGAACCPPDWPGPHFRMEWLVMPLTDAPQFGNLPDLWPAVHRALTGPEFRIDQGLPALILQTLPCFRRPSPVPIAASSTGSSGNTPPWHGAGPVLINLVLGLLLGLYPDATGKPQFAVRARVFGSIRAVLTSDQEAQDQFVSARMALVSLAMTEYLARVLPECMPAEEEFLRETLGMGQYFEQGALLCNEFRSGLASLDHEPGWRPLAAREWDQLDSRAAETVERMTRVKRKPIRHCELRNHTEDSGLDWRPAMVCPVVPAGSLDDYKILAHSFSLPKHGADVERFHSLIFLGRLPSNLLRMQIASLMSQVALERRFVRFRVEADSLHARRWTSGVPGCARACMCVRRVSRDEPCPCCATSSGWTR